MKRSLSFLSIALSMVLVATYSHASIFLDINPSIPGESSTFGYNHVIELQSASFLSSNSLQITKYADTTSLLLFQADINGTILPSMDLLIYGADATISAPFLIFHFTNTFVSSFTSVSFGQLPGETVYFTGTPPPVPIAGVLPDFTPWVDPQPQAGFSVTSAVPEPATYIMLLAGLGLVSFTRRWKQYSQRN
jgi:type VI protein secretion system component Hcp